MDCEVCCETVKEFKIVSCISCKYNCCSDCVKHYLLDTTQDVHCMACHCAWSRDFMYSNFTNSFINKTLKVHREKVLFERELSMLPATQPAADNELWCRDINQQIETFKNQKKMLLKQVNELSQSINELNATLQRGAFDENHSHMTRKCPGSNCKGFLNSELHCSLCNINVCAECNDTIDIDHVCDENTVKCMKLLASDSKPCPSCGTFIHKLVGCDQMYCTSCNTGFSWKTGLKITGIIHNPHYYEFMRQNPSGNLVRNLGDFECGGLPAIHEVHQLFAIDTVESVYILTSKIQNRWLPKYRVPPNHTNEDIRIKYMLNEIDDKTFRMTIQKREKCRAKNQDIYDILDMYQNTTCEYLRQIRHIGIELRYVDTELKRDIIWNSHALEIKTFVAEMYALRTYTNLQMHKLSKLYNNHTPFIVEGFQHIILMTQ